MCFGEKLFSVLTLVLQTLVYFDPLLNDVIQETDHRLLTGYNKPIIGCEKTEFHIKHRRCIKSGYIVETQALLITFLRKTLMKSK